MRSLFITTVLALAAITAVPPAATGVESKYSKERVYHPERHAQSQSGAESIILDLVFPWPFGWSIGYQAASVAPDAPRDLEQQLLDTGVIRLSNIFFGTACADLRPESHRVLDEIGRLMSQNPDLKIEIAGHADSRGSESFNQELSELRASAVKHYLIRTVRAINGQNLKTIGYGETRPVAPNDNPKGLQENRRVEFKVLD